MNFFILLFLAIIQGLTEFLPISSSGHLVLFYNLFNINDNTRLLSILLHIATLLSVIIYYRKEVVALVRHPLCPTNRKIFVTTLITCLIVLIIKPIIDLTFDGSYLFAFFIITAILLFVSDYVTEKRIFLSRTQNFMSQSIPVYQNNDITNIDVSYKQSVIIGITQAIACIPGISRSGSTISVANMCGVKDSARYSFLISIPIIIASFVMELLDIGRLNLNIEVIPIIFSMIVCFVIGLLCIKVMTKISSTNKLSYFAYYLLALSTVLVVLSFFK